MTIWIVWQVIDHEGWQAEGYFTNEDAANACLELLRERDRAEVKRLREAVGGEWIADYTEYFNEYTVEPVAVHGTLAEWLAVGEVSA